MQRFGLFGWPIAHSLSPSIHNSAFQKAGLNWVYELWPTLPEQLKEALELFRFEKRGGANVTIPHKETIMAYLDGLSAEAEAIGAVNTLFWQEDKLIGGNTDAEGFLKDLRDLQIDIHNQTALILGAGGSAKAIRYALENTGVQIETWTRSRGELIIEKQYELIVNCTPGLDPELLQKLQFFPGQVLYDLVYTPQMTPLMQKALDEGARAYNGKGMLVAQAFFSSEIWKQQACFLNGFH